MLSELIDTSGWTHEQWLAASILVFIGIAVLLIAHRVYKLMHMTRQTRYRPNLRRLRRSRSYQAYLQQQDRHDDEQDRDQNTSS